MPKSNINTIFSRFIKRVSQGNIDAVKAYLSEETQSESLLSMKDDYGSTALMKAARLGKKEVVELLLAHPKLPEDALGIKDCYGNTALMEAARLGKKEVVELLLAHPKLPEDALAYNGALINAAGSGVKEVVELLLADPRLPDDARAYNGALINAAGSGVKEVVELLLAHPKLPEDALGIKDCYGNTALFRAVTRGYKEVVELLLAHPKLPEDALGIKDRYGNTALMVAARIGKKEVVELLLAHPKLPEDALGIKDCYGNTALMFALHPWNKGIVKLLLADPRLTKDDLAIRDEKGYTALMHAVSRADKEIVELLLSDPRLPENALAITDKFGNTALIWAAATSSIEIVELLLAHPKLLKDALAITDKFGNTALTKAFNRLFDEDKVVVNLLLQKGAPVSDDDYIKGLSSSNAVTKQAFVLAKHADQLATMQIFLDPIKGSEADYSFIINRATKLLLAKDESPSKLITHLNRLDESTLPKDLSDQLISKYKVEYYTSKVLSLNEIKLEGEAGAVGGAGAGAAEGVAAVSASLKLNGKELKEFAESLKPSFSNYFSFEKVIDYANSAVIKSLGLSEAIKSVINKIHDKYEGLASVLLANIIGGDSIPLLSTMLDKEQSEFNEKDLKSLLNTDDGEDIGPQAKQVIKTLWSFKEEPIELVKTIMMGGEFAADLPRGVTTLEAFMEEATAISASGKKIIKAEYGDRVHKIYTELKNEQRILEEGLKKKGEPGSKAGTGAAGGAEEPAVGGAGAGSEAGAAGTSVTPKEKEYKYIAHHQDIVAKLNSFISQCETLEANLSDSGAGAGAEYSGLHRDVETECGGAGARYYVEDPWLYYNDRYLNGWHD